ncbi:hypothetical protein AD998_01895 [bacterium 336/3]|nr:hypothetical protein AD998_01895 [bacterium 336/3]
MFTDIIKLAQKISESGKIMIQRLSNMKGEVVKPTSFYKAEMFEAYVEDNLFPTGAYDLITRTDIYERNKKRFAKSSLNPDLFFQCKTTKGYFFVECKYRYGFEKDGTLIWCKDYQFERYRKLNKPDRPVFVAIGFTGLSKNPNRLFFFHINQVESHIIDQNVITQFEVEKKAINYIYLKSLSGKQNL